MVLALFAGIAALLILARLVGTPPTTDAASIAVRDHWTREVRQTWLPRLQAASGDSAAAVAERMAAELELVLNRQITRIDIRRGLLGPPVLRPTFYLRVQASPAGVSYYRMRGDTLTGVSPFWWRLPLR